MSQPEMEDIEDMCKAHEFCEEDMEKIRLSLLAWYATAKRDLPWRRWAQDFSLSDSQRAYGVWVSEVMCQQTQVGTVIPYYERWMGQWPTVQRLAEASLEEVNEAWAGLGYYSRGRRLHEGARKVVSDLAGEMPKNSEDLLNLLPGVGRYTSCAIASITYSEPVGVVDGNVQRVLSRLRAFAPSFPDQGAEEVDEKKKKAEESEQEEEDPADHPVKGKLGGPASKRKSTQPTSAIANAAARKKAKSASSSGLSVSKINNEITKWLWATANALVDTKKPGDFNQALMELGALVCTPKSPACGDCPVREYCLAHKQSAQPAAGPRPIDGCKYCLPIARRGNVEIFPIKAPKKRARIEVASVLVVEDTDEQGEKRFLLVQRPDSGLLAGLWQFPTVAHPSAPAAANEDGKGGAEDSSEEEDTSSPSRGKRKVVSCNPLIVRDTSAEVSALLKELDRFMDLDAARSLQKHVSACGSVVHLFTHIHHTYHVFCLHLGVAESSAWTAEEILAASLVRSHTKSSNLRWLTKEEMFKAAVPTNVKKMFKQHEASCAQSGVVAKPQNKVAGKGKAAAKVAKDLKPTKQATLHAMWGDK